MDPPLTFAKIFCDELLALHPDLVPAEPTKSNIYESIDKSDRPLAALCLSGGGIRSAAFALGVLQGLSRFRLLDQFHYLSTVSGGGYIGSWLTAWRYRQRITDQRFGNPTTPSDQAVFEAIDRTLSKSGKEAAEIGDLRADSNYLTPKLGVLSADTWAVIAICIRNIVLNWLVFLPVFMGLLLIPRWFNAVNEWIHQSGTHLDWLKWVGLAAVTIGLTVSSYGRRSAASHFAAGYQRILAIGDLHYVLGALLPILVAAMAFTAYAVTLTVQNAPSIWTGAVAGMVCYLLAWIAAGALLAGLTAARFLVRVAQKPLDLICDAVSWAVAGAAAGLLLAVGLRLAADASVMLPSVPPPPDSTLDPARAYHAQWLTVFGASWLMLSIFAATLLYIGLRSYSRHGDMDREWLGRADGWLAAAAASWAVIAGVALFAEFVLDQLYMSVLIGGLSGFVTLAFGSSARTAATEAKKLAGLLTLEQTVSVAGLIFALFLALCISVLDGRLSDLLDVFYLRFKPWLSAWLDQWMVYGAGAAVLLALGLIASFAINVNRFSLHAMYRNRLIRAFLGSARARADPLRKPDRFTGFDPDDNMFMSKLPTDRLLHLVNITLNVVATKKLAWQERKAESFSVTPLAVGNCNVGYRRTKCYGDPRGGITLGTAMAISGAAVSPNMGYHSSPIVGLLLMLFNVRLGWWLGNPRRDSYRQDGPTFSAVPLAEELAGQTTDQRRWVYLSDGGHFENLGLYEMVRRRCRIIVVSDAGCDPKYAYEDLANAARKIYIDLGVSVDFKTMDLSARGTPPRPAAYCALGKITYPGSTRLGWILYIKPGYHGTEPIHIQGYANAHASFPHESTADQFFSESQFEAYRGLGAHITELICGGGDKPAPTVRPPRMTLDSLKAQAQTYLAAVAQELKSSNADAAGNGAQVPPE